MFQIPALRFGQPYKSLETIEIPHHRTRAAVATVSQVNSGVILRDFRRMAEARRRLGAVTSDELIEICRRAARSFMEDALPLGDTTQSPEDYVASVSATTGMPVTLCRQNMEKLSGVLANMRNVLSGLTRGLDLRSLDVGRPAVGGRGVRPPSEFRLESDCLGCVLPSNSPGVHGLWLPAVALKTPLVVKPGREEPWTPMRLAQSFLAAGCPGDALCYYPTDHAGAAEILRLAGRSLLFGDASTTQPYAGDARVQLHGPGYSKVLIGADCAATWPRFVELIASSIAENGGRSCLNASAVWTPIHGRALAESLAAELVKIEALPADDERARLAAFANPATAEYFNRVIDEGLRSPGATDVTAVQRARTGNGPERLVRIGNCSYVLPTLIHCASPEHPLANREFLFPYAAVVDCPCEHMLSRIGPTLVATALTEDESWIEELASSRDIDRLNIGAIPTWTIDWNQPHEGNLFELLYRRRAITVA